MGPQFSSFANAIFFFHRHLEHNCLHSRWSHGVDENSLLHLLLPTQCAWIADKNTLFLLPHLIPFAHKAPPNISSSILHKNISALSYKASCDIKQSFPYLALHLLCVLMLLLSAVASACFSSSYLPSFWYSFSYFYYIFSLLYFCGVLLVGWLVFFLFPFCVSSPQQNGCVPC